MFQRRIKIALSTARWQFSLVYLADVVVFSCSASEYIDNVKHVLMILDDARAAVKLKKRNFFTETIHYLGHVIYPGRLEIASHTRDAVK